MNWDGYTIAVYSALALSARHGGHVALGIRSPDDTPWSIVGVGIDDFGEAGEHAPRSAMVNLLQHATESFPTVALSRKPTERDMGMARLRSVKHLCFFNGEQAAIQSRSKEKFTSPWPGEPGPTASSGIDTEPLKLDLPDFSRGSNAAETSNRWLEEVLLDWKAPTDYNDGLKDGQRRKWVKLAAEGLQVSMRAFGERDAKVPFHRFTPDSDFGLPRFEGVRANRLDRWRHDLFMQLAFAVAGQAHYQRRRLQLQDGHPIASVLRGTDDQILAWSINTRGGNPTLHGEVNLIETYFQRHPEATRIGTNDATIQPLLYSTLEPCWMCAGMYLTAGDGLHCKFGQNDPNIRGTNALRARALERHHRTPTGDALARETDGVSGKFTDALALRHAQWANAVFDYFRLALGYTGGRDAWEKANDRRKVWYNGLRLLVHIDPNVDPLWERVAGSQRPPWPAQDGGGP